MSNGGCQGRIGSLNNCSYFLTFCDVMRQFLVLIPLSYLVLFPRNWIFDYWIGSKAYGNACFYIQTMDASSSFIT